MTEDYSTATDAELAVACSLRPAVKPAWKALLQRYRSIVESKIGRMSATLPRPQVEELRQEIFLRLFLYLPKYDGKRASLETLVMRLTASVVIDYWRHWKRERETTVGIEEDPRAAHGAAIELHIPAAEIERIGRVEADAFENPVHRCIAHLVLDQVSGPKIERQLDVSLDVIYTVRRKLKQRVQVSLEQYRSAHDLKK